jgi:hypothetical protein
VQHNLLNQQRVIKRKRPNRAGKTVQNKTTKGLLMGIAEPKESGFVSLISIEAQKTIMLPEKRSGVDQTE